MSSDVGDHAASRCRLLSRKETNLPPGVWNVSIDGISRVWTMNVTNNTTNNAYASHQRPRGRHRAHPAARGRHRRDLVEHRRIVGGVTQTTINNTGTAGSQSPLITAVDAAGHGITNLSSLQVTNGVALIGPLAIWQAADGHMVMSNASALPSVNQGMLEIVGANNTGGGIGHSFKIRPEDLTWDTDAQFGGTVLGGIVEAQGSGGNTAQMNEQTIGGEETSTFLSSTGNGFIAGNAAANGETNWVRMLYGTDNSDNPVFSYVEFDTNATIEANGLVATNGIRVLGPSTNNTITSMGVTVTNGGVTLAGSGAFTGSGSGLTSLNGSSVSSAHGGLKLFCPPTSPRSPRTTACN